jgi:hypothetical protein
VLSKSEFRLAMFPPFPDGGWDKQLQGCDPGCLLAGQCPARFLRQKQAFQFPHERNLNKNVEHAGERDCRAYEQKAQRHFRRK